MTDQHEISHSDIMNYEWFNPTEFAKVLKAFPEGFRSKLHVTTARNHLNFIICLSISAQLSRLKSRKDWQSFYDLLVHALEFARVADEYSLDGEIVPRISSETCHNMEVLQRELAPSFSGLSEKNAFPRRNTSGWQAEFYPWILGYYKCLTGEEAKPSLKGEMNKRTDISIIFIEKIIENVSKKLSELSYNAAFNPTGGGDLVWENVGHSAIQDRIAFYQKVPAENLGADSVKYAKWKARYNQLLLQGKVLKDL